MVFGRRKLTSSSNEVDSVVQRSKLPDSQQVDDDSDDDDEEEADMEQAPKTSATSISSSSFSFRTPSTSSSQPSPVNHTENYKFGIMERLNDAVAMKVANSTATYRSPDLIPLMKSFDSLRKKLRQMIASSKKYHQSMMTLDLDRIQMAKEIASFADGTPMKDKVNKVDDPLSFISVFHNASNASAKNSFKYKNEVLAYCIEWEAVVSTRVDKDVQDIKKLREMFNHYQDKVDALRRKVNVQETKGKSVNTTLAEKLQRNEEKLDEASGLYESSARPLCVLIEEVVQYGYKDLYPFIVAIMKFEMERSQSESRALHLFQCEVFESEFGPNMSGIATHNTIRPLASSSSSSNGKNKQPESTPKKVMNKKMSSKSLSGGNTARRGKNNNSTKSTTTVKPKREPVVAINRNSGIRNSGDLDEGQSESSSSVPDDNLSAKVETV